MVLVIADDLTGGNGTGVRAMKGGLSAYTVMGDGALPDANAFSVVIVPTDSRNVSVEEAYSRVQAAVRRFDAYPVSLYSKRIDSTLRGNLGSEIDAVLDNISPAHVAFVVPAYPDAGRISAGGHVLVEQQPLYRTAAAKDPKNPITTARTDVLLQQQSHYPVASLYLEDYAAGADALVARIEQLMAAGARLLVCDACQQEDIDMLADCALAWGGRFIAADPGPFTAALSMRLERKKEAPSAQILAAIGSVNAVAQAQVETLMEDPDAYMVFLETAEILEGGARAEDEKNRVVAEVLAHGQDYPVCAVVSCGIFPQRRTAFAPYMARYACTAEELSNQINDAFGSITAEILRRNSACQGLFTSGGDITVAVCRHLGAQGLALVEEVIPLTSFARLVGGSHAGLKLITKGGMVGDKNTLKECFSYLQKQMAR